MIALNTKNYPFCLTTFCLNNKLRQRQREDGLPQVHPQAGDTCWLCLSFAILIFPSGLLTFAYFNGFLKINVCLIKLLVNSTWYNCT